jgi:hypothetical protein
MTPVFSTSYLPPIVYVANLLRHTEVLIETKETFPKQTYRNRTEIMTAGGVRALSVPVIRNNHSRTEDVGIDYKERWNIIHLRTIAAAYSSSPYYLYYKDDFEALLTKRYNKLVDLNETLLKWILKLLKSNCQLRRTEDYQKEYALDFRNTFSPKVPYPTVGHEKYYQVFSDRIPFTPNLSIIDLLMNLGPEAREYLKMIT